MPPSHQIPGTLGVGVSRGFPWEALVWHSSHRCINPQNNNWDQQQIHYLNMAEVSLSLGWFYPLSATSANSPVLHSCPSFPDFLQSTSPIKITSSCIWVAIPVDWVILHWYACGADGQRVDGRTGTWLPKFFGWVDYHIFLGMGLRSRGAPL